MQNICRPFLFTVLLLFVSFSSFAQQNSVIDDLLQEEKATFGNCVYLVLSASGVIDESLLPEEAVAGLEFRDLHFRPKKADDFITFGEFAVLLMEGFEFKGGLFYTIFPGPRYASREMVFKGFIHGRAGPYGNISGHDALTMVRKAKEWKERYR